MKTVTVLSSTCSPPMIPKQPHHCRMMSIAFYLFGSSRMAYAQGIRCFWYSKNLVRLQQISMGLRPQHFRLQALPANPISGFTSVVLRRNSKRRAQLCQGLLRQTHNYRMQKPCPKPISERNNETEQRKCWKKRLLGKSDEMIQNESLTQKDPA